MLLSESQCLVLCLQSNLSHDKCITHQNNLVERKQTPFSDIKKPNHLPDQYKRHSCLCPPPLWRFFEYY